MGEHPIFRLAYRVDDAAGMLGVSKSKVWELINEGRIPARKIDAATVIRHADLQAFIDSAPPAEATKRAQSASR